MEEPALTSAEFYQSVFLPFLEVAAFRTGDWYIVSLHTYQRVFSVPASTDAFETFRQRVLAWEPYVSAYRYYVQVLNGKPFLSFMFAPAPTSSPLPLPTYPQFLTLFRQLCKLMNLVNVQHKTYVRSKPFVKLHIAVERNACI